MAAPEREAQVSYQCKRLAELSETLSARLERLEDKLKAVLMPEPPTKAAGQDKETELSLCELAVSIQSINDRLDWQIRFVDGLMKRIEI